ncbi:hypothetical protein [Curtobacterium sp. MCBA15_001]|uniref:hypothetical protein n=1 Tax=Curtobacterium sp. MCBA15_001 TaxID=1898731 RepID=UPI0008DE5335|nr:hypothetical protein [Curtobacterium sp. MCBA15_001]OIH95123.1 hypothetical protein BIU90_03025 [Curtobacterium sp. MCBA15_001]
MRRPTLVTAAAVAALATAMIAMPGIASAETTVIQSSPHSTAATPTGAQSRAAVAPLDTEWVGAADVTAYTTGAYPTAWFSVGGTPTFGVSGAALPAGTLLGHATTGSAATDLAGVRSTALASQNGLGLGTADLIASGAARYTLLLDTAGSTANTAPAALTTSATGPTAVDGTWVSTVTVGTIAAGTPATLADFQTQFAAAFPAATINGYGVSATAAAGAVVGISWNGEDTYFTPEASGTLSVPDPTTSSSLGTTGVVVDATGFLPGETVQPVVILQDLEVLPSSETFTADANGAISGRATFGTAVPEGEVVIAFTGRDSGIAVVFPVTVIADPTTPVVRPTPAPAPVAVPVSGRATFTG